MAKTTNNEDEPKRPRKGLDLLYRLTHYDSYHSYRVRMAIVRSLLWLAVVLYIYKLFIPNYQTDIFVNDIIIFLLGSYLIAYYSVTAKASIMFKDSAYVMRKIAFSGVISNSWNIYDGILKDPEEGEVSVEITFFKEKAFLVNVFDLNLVGDNIPDSLATGMNIHIIAIVDEYDSNSGLFQLVPVETRMR